MACIWTLVEGLCRKIGIHLHVASSEYLLFLFGATLFIVLPILFLGKIGLSFSVLFFHNIFVFAFKNATPCNNPTNFRYNTSLAKFLRMYGNIPGKIREHLKSFVCRNQDLKKVVYGEQELQKKKER